ncbi:MAG: hypothetical protein QG635_80 [Bacteroidota bacterium]|nr:hypothetical protein [Bacteroidota bacterium]
MQIIIKILLLFTVILAFGSCRDSLGIDPNYQWKYLDPDSLSGIGKKPVPYYAAAQNITFYEYKKVDFFVKGISSSCTFKSNMVKIDTSKGYPIISIEELEAESLEKDEYFIRNQRTQRVSSMLLKLDSVGVHDTITVIMNGDSKSGRYLSVFFKSLQTGKESIDISRYEGSSIFIENYINEGYIKLIVSVNVAGLPGIDIMGFQSVFWVYYRNQ